MDTEYPYYAIVTFGAPTIGRIRSYYRSLETAERDAKELSGGTMTTCRIVGCDTRQQAIDANIAGRRPVVWQR